MSTPKHFSCNNWVAKEFYVFVVNIIFWYVWVPDKATETTDEAEDPKFIEHDWK